MMRLSVSLLLSVTTLISASSVPQTPKTLQIYVVDVEGGKATLVVSPSQESLLIDTGNVGDGAYRDAARIMAAITDAGLVHIDHLITTHWDPDHFGGMAVLAGHLPILEFIDHGASVQPDAHTDRFLQTTYPALYGKAGHILAKPGDRISMSDLDVRVVTSAGHVIDTALHGAGKPNPYCAGFKPLSIDRSEDAQSIGIRIAFGDFRVLDLADLSVDKEFELMCPDNRIGAVDLFMVSHHGQPSSNSRVLVQAIESRVAIMNNGTRKGGQPEVMRALHSAPGLEDLWQLHFSQLSGQEYTVPGLFIANLVDEPQPVVPVAPMPAPRPEEAAPPAPVHNGPAYWIKVSAHRDGSFEVTNGRNGFSKLYRARKD